MPASDQQTILQLNAILRHMLAGINQFFLHARVLKHQGQLRLADYTYKSSIDAMKFSDMVVEHILQMNGAPNMQDLAKLSIGTTPEEMLANDCQHAQAVLALIHTAMEANPPKATSELLKRIAENQQEHVQSLGALLSSNALSQPIKDCA